MRRDYKGIKFNKLTLLSYVGPGGGTRGAIWLASCECGNVVEVHGRDVAAGRKRNCGKCPEGLAKTRGGYRARSAAEARLRRLLAKTARKALRQGLKFALSYNDISGMSLDKCTLCNSELRIQALSLEVVEEVQGYTVTNSVAICPQCRRHMAGDNLLQYLTYLRTLNH